MILIGTKCDLEDMREVSKEEGQTLAQKYRCPFFESSAKARINIKEPIYEITNLVVNKEKIWAEELLNETTKQKEIMEQKKSNCLLM